MRFVGRHAKLALVLGAAVALHAAGGAAAQTPDQELARTYAPVLKLKGNEDLPCSTAGEQYMVTSVETILGNPAVQLVRVEPGKSKVVMRGATAADIGELGQRYYLNQPGNPYRPGCEYARDSRRLTRGRPPVAYAHIIRAPRVRRIALQYWFYYWFNRFNDLHESDWEAIQLAFDADTVAGAIAHGPSEIAYAQHGGGERAEWNEAKVSKEHDTHPVVYVASGSHASQYESALYLGRGRQGSGLGCDDTRGGGAEGDLHTTVRPMPVVVPTHPASTRGSFAWLTYRGHWGQHARGFSNGVTGPNTKAQWQRPFAWMDRLRSSTPKMPVSEAAGPTVTTFFCDAIIAITNVVNYVGGRMWVTALLLGGILVVTLVPIRRTRWRPAPIEPLRRERAAGQLLRVAGRLYGRLALPLLALVLMVLAIAFAITRLLQLLADRAGLTFELPLGGNPGVDGFSSLVVAAPAYPIVLFLIGAPMVAILRRIEAGEPTVPWVAVGEVITLLPRLLWAEVLALGAVGLLLSTVIGIPYAIKKAVDWTFAGQVIVFERRKARPALSTSTDCVRGRWWSIAGVDVALFVVGAVVGPLLGATLILVTDIPLWTINVIGVATFGLALPYMIITLTLMYLDPRRREASAPRPRRRRLAFWRRNTPLPANVRT